MDNDLTWYFIAILLIVVIFTTTALGYLFVLIRRRYFPRTPVQSLDHGHELTTAREGTDARTSDVEPVTAIQESTAYSGGLNIEGHIGPDIRSTTTERVAQR
jgi:hypothetical protein